MARYAKDNGVAQKTTRAGVTITIQLTPDLKWQVDVDSKVAPLRDAVQEGYARMLATDTEMILLREGGWPGPDYGHVQTGIFNEAVANIGFEIVQPIPAPKAPEPYHPKY